MGLRKQKMPVEDEETIKGVYLNFLIEANSQINRAMVIPSE